MQSVLAKTGNLHKMKKRRPCQHYMASFKNETVVLRMIYKKSVLEKNIPTSPAACGGTGSSVKRSENWSHPIPSIGLGRHTTTTTRNIRSNPDPAWKDMYPFRDYSVYLCISL